MKNGAVKFETNAEKSEFFVNHFAFCFFSKEKDDEYNKHNIEYADKIPNKITKEINDSITPISPKEIQQIITKLANKKAEATILSETKLINLTPKTLSYLTSLYKSAMRVCTFLSS